jgi:hypothetical protein
VSDDFMFVLKFDAKHGVRKQFRHDAGKLKQFFFRHDRPVYEPAAAAPISTTNNAFEFGAETSGIAARSQLLNLLETPASSVIPAGFRP